MSNIEIISEWLRKADEEKGDMLI